MNLVNQEWVDKAEGDLLTARRELAATESANYDAVCFHAQQAAEKYLKALLQQRLIKFPKTHDLVELMELAVRIDPSWEDLRDRFDALDDFSVDIRYPGAFADKPAAREALDIAQEVRKRARGLLALE